MTQSKEAMDLAVKIVAKLVKGRTITEPKSVLRVGDAVNELYFLIETTLAKARLEGARAMQEEAAITGSICVVKPVAREWIAKRIRALDPQQVINESIRK
jgi:hypothetical protein